ncbi:Glutamyl-tRNA(Gln) amidotransferase subunit A [Thelohanellus kitauei]|uniref:Glutamyl-tRNA(Gln) amidotransferase subunit A n=1 Tax=Thelohanellus kitauei TaxID=669202 RepID=A0A0C2MMX0_THEKT|nr:Glutamyl-tRNA(Gln) amidotransferase subunit A [Thelohanellus kitauei]
MSDRTAFCVQKLIDAGALLIGTTSMPQFGTNAIGFNTSPKLSSPKNVWDNQHYAGGSSSGSGIVVALGLCPFAVGSDSLGSIRIPSGCSGIVGLRPTFSRVSNSDCSEVWTEDPFQTIGPMASCIRDAAAIYLTMAGPDPGFSQGLHQPPLQPPLFSEFDLSKIRFGYYSDYLSNADPSQLCSFDEG